MGKARRTASGYGTGSVGPMLVSLRPPGSDGRLVLAVSPEGQWAEPGGRMPTPELSSGLWAIPGLVDSHSHLAADTLELAPGEPDRIARRAFACLDRGTFLVVDKGWCDTSVVATLSGRPPVESPDLEGAGRLIAVAGGYYPGFAVETDTAGLADVVATAVAEGSGWVKLVGDWPRRGLGAVANFDEASLATAVDVAHRGGARVAIHTMAPEVPSAAVRAGVDSVEHGLFLTAADLDSLADRHGAWVPTVLRMEAIGAMLGAESSGGRLIKEGLENVASLLAAAPDGLAVLAGTDLATPPGAVGEEVVALVKCGLAPPRAVEAASGMARRFLGRGCGFEPGTSADAVFYDADPYQDPTVLSRPAVVMRAGRLRV